MLLLYSRDAQAHPVRMFLQVVRSIRDADFDPDATRSGMFLQAQALSPQTEGHSPAASGNDDEAGAASAPPAIPPDQPPGSQSGGERHEGASDTLVAEPDVDSSDSDTADSSDSGGGIQTMLMHGALN